MTPTATLPVPALSPQVLAFAAEKGVAAYLPGVADMTRHLFPDRRINTIIDDDPELSDNRQILFEVDGDGMSAEAMFNGYRQWSEQIVQHCPTTHTHVFCMGLVPMP